jgi:hypothetical protein
MCVCVYALLRKEEDEASRQAGIGEFNIYDFKAKRMRKREKFKI